MNKKEKIEQTIDEIKEGFEIILEKLEGNEFEDFEIEDLAKMLKIFKKNTWIYS